MMKKPRPLALPALLLAALVFAPALFAQQPPPPPAPPAPRPPPPANPPFTNFGQPLAGLTAGETALYNAGLAVFRQRRTPQTGLGPIFNDNSCVACHSAPVTGGGSRRTVTRFGRTTDTGFDPLEALGGSLLQNRAIPGAPREVVPVEANTTTLRLTTPLFGAGLIEAIPDNTIILGTLQPKPAGIHGRVSVVDDIATGQQRIGRFGWKAQHATLTGFSADAFRNEMGITNRFFPVENAPNGNTAAIARFVSGSVDDPADASGKSDLDRAADYMRLLAAPPRGRIGNAELAGERLFTALDCAACHTPSLTTGKNDIAALSEKSVPLYSDLLLHDMGSLGDGIVQGTAGARDLRTAPLWGVRARRQFLHDSRATTLDAAILAHAGEAQASRDAYTQLDDQSRQQLIAFLNSL